MQKDVHYYLSLSLAVRSGISLQEAKLIAWADQFTDELTETELDGTQTQSAILGNWSDRQIQNTVIVPFHFVPGEDPQNRRIVTAGSDNVIKLLAEAVKEKNPFGLGIALHSMQDSFSHQGFSGWNEPANSCWPWYYLKSGIPNIGHAELGPVPDIANAVWTDPRTSEQINNNGRVFSAALITYQWLRKYANRDNDIETMERDIEDALDIEDYDNRKLEFLLMAKNDSVKRYSEISEQYRFSYHDEFIDAARRHLSVFMGLLTN